MASIRAKTASAPILQPRILEKEDLGVRRHGVGPTQLSVRSHGVRCQKSRGKVSGDRVKCHESLS